MFLIGVFEKNLLFLFIYIWFIFDAKSVGVNTSKRSDFYFFVTKIICSTQNWFKFVAVAGFDDDKPRPTLVQSQPQTWT